MMDQFHWGGSLRRALYGRRSERKERLLDQLELALDELTTSATEDAQAAEKAAARTTEVKGFVRRKPSRKPFPEQPNSASQCLTPLLDDGRLGHGRHPSFRARLRTGFPNCD